MLFLKDLLFARLTLSYARFGDALLAPSGVDTTKCDLCLSTVYVRPEAMPLFECGNEKYSVSIAVTVIAKSDGGGNHTIMILDDRSLGKNRTAVAITPEGMMCKFVREPFSYKQLCSTKEIHPLQFLLLAPIKVQFLLFLKCLKHYDKEEFHREVGITFTILPKGI